MDYSVGYWIDPPLYIGFIIVLSMWNIMLDVVRGLLVVALVRWYYYLSLRGSPLLPLAVKEVRHICDWTLMRHHPLDVWRHIFIPLLLTLYLRHIFKIYGNSAIIQDEAPIPNDVRSNLDFISGRPLGWRISIIKSIITGGFLVTRVVTRVEEHCLTCTNANCRNSTLHSLQHCASCSSKGLLQSVPVIQTMLFPLVCSISIWEVLCSWSVLDDSLKCILLDCIEADIVDFRFANQPWLFKISSTRVT